MAYMWPVVSFSFLHQGHSGNVFLPCFYKRLLVGNHRWISFTVEALAIGCTFLRFGFLQVWLVLCHACLLSIVAVDHGVVWLLFHLAKLLVMLWLVGMQV
jgi:hypothetical protein